MPWLKLGILTRSIICRDVAMTKGSILSIWVLLLCLSACKESPRFSVTENEEHRFSQNLVYLAQFSEDGSELSIVDENRQVTIWNLDNKQKVFNLSPSQTPQDIRAFFYKKAEGLVLIASENNIEFWDVKSKSKLGSLKVFSDEPLARISALSISTFGGVIAVGMTDGTVFLYNKSSNTSVQSQMHESTVNNISFGTSGRYILTTGLDGKVLKSSIENLEVQFVKEFKTRISTLVYDGHAQYIFVSDVLDNQNIFDFGSGDSISKLDYSSRFRWFRGGEFMSRQYLLTTSPKTSISMWKVDTGEEVLSWESKTLSLGSTTLDIKVNDLNVLTVTSEGVYQHWSVIEL